MKYRNKEYGTADQPQSRAISAQRDAGRNTPVWARPDLVDLEAFVARYVDEVYGPDAKKRPTTITGFEAKLLARVWVERIREVHEDWHVYGSISGGVDQEMHGWLRLEHLVDGGLLTWVDVDQIAEDVFIDAHDAAVKAGPPPKTKAEAWGREAELIPDAELPTAVDEDNALEYFHQKWLRSPVPAVPQVVRGSLARVRAQLVSDGLALAAESCLLGVYAHAWACGVEPLGFPTDERSVAVIRELLSAGDE
jgi:hypothetical protein